MLVVVPHVFTLRFKDTKSFPFYSSNLGFTLFCEVKVLGFYPSHYICAHYEKVTRMTVLNT